MVSGASVTDKKILSVFWDMPISPDFVMMFLLVTSFPCGKQLIYSVYIFCGCFISLKKTTSKCLEYFKRDR